MKKFSFSCERAAPPFAVFEGWGEPPQWHNHTDAARIVHFRAVLPDQVYVL